MARRTKKQQKAMDELLSFLFIVGGFGLYYLTKSIYLTVIIIGLCFVGLMIFIMLRNAKRNERLRLSGINEIDKMDGVVFEKYLREIYLQKGYRVSLTSVTGDYGADLILEKNNEKIVIQAKRYAKNVGIKAVQEVKAAQFHYKANEAWVVTNNNYTNAAISLAKSTNVKLISRDELIELSLSVKKQQAK
ncbi:restriction endonuclease [Gottfriedia sp. OAE603]|uniref:restriction endonuclease n=1 Tax=Gottfriedia sp. OAE603 TaxID=2663872 RepID=UPI001A001150